MIKFFSTADKDEHGKLEWFKPTKPAVTICCTSFRWWETSEGTLCCRCHKIVPGNTRTANFKEMNFESEEEYNEAYTE